MSTGNDRRLVVHVRDAINPGLAGHAGRHYTSPPLPAEQAQSLVALLLGCPAHAVDAGRSWTRPVAGGRRTITLAPA
jgi:hypothetical protein